MPHCTQHASPQLLLVRAPPLDRLIKIPAALRSAAPPPTQDMRADPCVLVGPLRKELLAAGGRWWERAWEELPPPWPRPPPPGRLSLLIHAPGSSSLPTLSMRLPPPALARPLADLVRSRPAPPWRRDSGCVGNKVGERWWQSVHGPSALSRCS
jgi:hypothetical protein